MTGSTTPSGVATRSIFKPLGRSKVARTRPTGSGRAAMSSRPRAIASTRPASSSRRSRKEGAMPRASAAATSRALAARISSVRARMAAAAAASALSLTGVGASARAAAALRARRPSAVMRACRSGSVRGRRSWSSCRHGYQKAVVSSPRLPDGGDREDVAEFCYIALTAMADGSDVRSRVYNLDTSWAQAGSVQPWVYPTCADLSFFWR